MHIPEYGQVQPELIGFLIPPAEGAPPGNGWAGAGKGDAFLREDGTARMIRQGSAGIDFQGNLKGFAAFRVPADGLIGDVLVRMSHPVAPAGAEDFSVDIEDGFTAGIQVHDDPFPAGFLRYGEAAEHPGIIPGHAPGGSGRPGFPGIGFRLPQVQDGRRRKALQGNFAQRVIKIRCQRVNHVPKLIGDFLIHLRNSFDMILLC